MADIQTLTQQSKGRAADVALGAGAEAGATTREAARTQQNILGLQAGQAARTQSDITGGLAKLGGDIIAPTIERVGTDVRDKIFTESRTEEDPLLRLGALTGGSRIV